MMHQPKLCELCRADVAWNFHHLIPRTLHSNKWFKKNFSREQMRSGIDVCKDCHRSLHKLVPSEKELGRHFNTVDKLLAHPTLAKYVAWKRRKARVE